MLRYGLSNDVNRFFRLFENFGGVFCQNITTSRNVIASTMKRLHTCVTTFLSVLQ